MRRIFGPDIERDIDDELRFHLEMKVADLEARGVPADVARRAARERFGDVNQVRHWLRRHDRRRQRRVERVEYMDALVQDVRYGARKLRQQPGFAAAVILVLALGIGAATAMFSAVDAALLRPLPFAEDDRLVMLPSVSIPTEGSAERPKELVETADVEAMPGVERVAAYAAGGLNLGGDAPRRVRVALVTPDFFPTLGVRPQQGRALLDAEGQVGSPHVAVVSHDLWRRDLGGDADVLRRTVVLNGIEHQVVGVMPPRFGFPDDAELWLPLRLPFQYADMEAFREYLPSAVIARLAPGTTPEQVDARIATLAAALRDAAGLPPSEGSELRPVQPLRDVLVGARRTPLLVLLGATGLVVLVACANAANLLLSRAGVRRAEMALRAVLGATRTRIVRQLLVESVLLALAGGALGVAIAYAGMGVMPALMPDALAGIAAPRVDARVLGFSALLAMVVGVVFGLWPALGTSRSDPATAIRSGGGMGGTARGSARARRIFVVAELALALMLAVGTALMLRSLQSLLATDLGFSTERVATLELSLARAVYPTGQLQTQFHDAVLERLSALPGVDGAAATTVLPLRRGGVIGFPVFEEGKRPQGRPTVGIATFVTPDYFRTMGIPLRGVTLQPRPDSGEREVVISAGLARAIWGEENPVGRRLMLMGQGARRVVGVAGDVRVMSVEREPTEQLYLPLAEAEHEHIALVARGSLPAGVLGARMQDAVRAVDPSQAVFAVQPLERVIASSIAPRRTTAWLVTTFGVVAVLLAAAGVYGVIAFGVTQRTREIGIRMALGAGRADVLRLVVREGVLLAVGGVAVGLAGAWALRRAIESLLYGVASSDLVAFTAAPLVLLVVALAATLLPARAATRVQPTVAMRAE